jgi:hypothetical protein
LAPSPLRHAAKDFNVENVIIRGYKQNQAVTEKCNTSVTVENCCLGMGSPQPFSDLTILALRLHVSEKFVLM